ncbi:Cytochrome P450 [Tylopilus felleus]
MFDWTTTGTLALGCVAVLYIGQRALGNRVTYPFPPGPPGLPWVGNVIGVSRDAPWITYAEWARTYGGLMYTRLLGKDVIIISSEKIAKDLLEVRSKNYSDRPYFIASEMCGLDFASSLLQYGDQWRLHRRFFHQTFRLDAVARFLPYQHRRACHLLRQLFEAPEQLDDHVFEYTVAVIMNSTYDFSPASHKDELVDIVANVLNIIVPALRPDTAMLISALPLFRYLPSWFPGMSFKRGMAEARAYSKVYLDRPFAHSLQKLPDGVIAPSMVHDGLRSIEERGIAPDESWMQALKEASGTAFLGACPAAPRIFSYSNSVLMTFFLMMVLHPAIQEKAHVQIDTEVGRDRLPAMKDRPLLPFIDAILRETLRYGPITPLSVAHAVVDDDMYGGFHIPKGATVITNVWSMAHDESRYPNSHAFLPERFLKDDGSLTPNDIEHIVFGFGRRICVGRHFADTSLWMVITKVLALFKILRPLDEHGVEIPVEPKFSSGIAVHPLPFRCRIVPRFPGMDVKKLEELIAASTA